MFIAVSTFFAGFCVRLPNRIRQGVLFSRGTVFFNTQTDEFFLSLENRKWAAIGAKLHKVSAGVQAGCKFVSLFIKSLMKRNRV